MEPEQRDKLREIQEEHGITFAELHRTGLNVVIGMYAQGREDEADFMRLAEVADNVVAPDDEYPRAAAALSRQCRALAEGSKAVYAKLQAERSDYDTLWKRYQLTRNALRTIKAKVDKLLGYPTHEEDSDDDETPTE